MLLPATDSTLTLLLFDFRGSVGSGDGWSGTVCHELGWSIVYRHQLGKLCLPLGRLGSYSGSPPSDGKLPKISTKAFLRPLVSPWVVKGARLAAGDAVSGVCKVFPPEIPLPHLALMTLSVRGDMQLTLQSVLPWSLQMAMEKRP